MKLRTIGMATVAALAVIATGAQAQETTGSRAWERDVGWNTKYGMLFQRRTSS
jgi:hypothetical protein